MAEPALSDGFDYFIVFGAAVRPDGQPSAVLRDRVESGYRLARGRPHARFLVTGGLGRFPPPECEVMRALLIERGVPPETIVTECEAHDTLSSAVLCTRILAARGDAESVTVCSSPYHLPRCRLVLKVLGVDTRKVPMPGGRRGLRRAGGLRACLREAVAIPWDLLLALRLRLFGVSKP